MERAVGTGAFGPAPRAELLHVLMLPRPRASRPDRRVLGLRDLPMTCPETAERTQSDDGDEGDGGHIERPLGRKDQDGDDRS
jgi:hypothetical protein